MLVRCIAWLLALADMNKSAAAAAAAAVDAQEEILNLKGTACGCNMMTFSS